MLRYRRYRVFVAFAVISLFVLYHLGSPGTPWRNPIVVSPKRPKVDPVLPNWKPRPPLARETKKLVLDIPAATASISTRRPPPIPPLTRHLDLGDPAPTSAVRTSTEHWQRQSERFPIPSSAVIQLPTGKPNPIPKIQHVFKRESAQQKEDREQKLEAIRDVFKRSWYGYRDHAWLQDELQPVSGGFRNPFASWGATLVDALDTLWIMGLKEEFEEAVEGVKKIDFTTSPRADIPLFETTIRYLGGLLAAHDLSEGKYQVLLEKATELAEVLISAFDTPNRMPITYYHWKPSTSRQDRADNRAVMAEIGSLSVEFTRLSQLTGEPKYYDAIARITDSLEEFQNRTRLAGMWPSQLDASGCKLIIPDPPEPVEVEMSTEAKSKQDSETTAATATVAVEGPNPPKGKKFIPLDLPSPIVFVAQTPKSESKSGIVAREAPTLGKRQYVDGKEVAEEKSSHLPTKQNKDVPSPSPTGPYCVETGLAPSEIGSEEYSLGGMADSTYEYLPKEWLLLGGQIDQYRTMYEKSIEVVKQNLVFRPMLPDEDDVLFCGKLHVPDPHVGDPLLEGEYAHLTCFAGGMFGMASKIFNRPEDLEIAKKLTEGCVWGYDMTPTGIMPEAFIAVPCEDAKNCHWNETKYWEAIDPGAEARIKSYHRQMETYEKQMSSASRWYQSELAAMTAPPTQTATSTTFEATATSTLGAKVELDAGLKKRQAEDIPPEDIEPQTPVQVEIEEEPSGEPTPTMPEFPFVYSPVPPQTHKEYVHHRITYDHLPKGVVSFPVKSYILRPEAIESVWYMYRITGDPKWREAGWRMFQAVNNYTQTTYGNSAIDDVTKEEPILKDEMESFWLAETLKYFYLLFAEEDVISLDDWVLNTEAHPFRRPK